MISPLVGLQSDSPVGQPEVGDLATALLWTADGDKPFCVRIERFELGNAWVKVIGLGVKPPYQIGDRLVIDAAKVVDWQ